MGYKAAVHVYTIADQNLYATFTLHKVCNRIFDVSSFTNWISTKWLFSGQNRGLGIFMRLQIAVFTRWSGWWFRRRLGSWNKTIDLWKSCRTSNSRCYYCFEGKANFASKIALMLPFSGLQLRPMQLYHRGWKVYSSLAGRFEKQKTLASRVQLGHVEAKRPLRINWPRRSDDLLWNYYWWYFED